MFMTLLNVIRESLNAISMDELPPCGKLKPMSCEVRNPLPAPGKNVQGDSRHTESSYAGSDTLHSGIGCHYRAGKLPMNLLVLFFLCAD